ncbi:LamB/YcsF family protein [Saccharopolyspora sp. MS10]|uniref:LamB/YcsF family protein n=1 Tax=Saccharopolyspora sp. MS10 TaxID=3385973 RepID=UPI0039A05992
MSGGDVRIDLNSDLAEGFGRWELGDDAALLGIVSSANVACGFHAGDPGVIRRACAQAAARSVSVGAQVGYRDLAGFGRRFVDVPPRELTDEVVYQLAALDGIARVEGTAVRYVKPHGALYNAIVRHAEQAAAVVEAVSAYDPRLAVLGLPGSSWLEQAAAAGLPVFREAFADRAYTPEGTLVSRREPGAVLHDPELIARRCLRIVRGEPVEAVDGSEIAVTAESICVHGDSPGAVAIAEAVRDRLLGEGVEVRPFVPGPGR